LLLASLNKTRKMSGNVVMMADDSDEDVVFLGERKAVEVVDIVAKPESTATKRKAIKREAPREEQPSLTAVPNLGETMQNKGLSAVMLSEVRFHLCLRSPC
jgi:hypothetical protein